MENELQKIMYPTDDEKKWVSLLATGEKATKVAEMVGLNKNTFAYHLKFLRTKYACKNTPQLISFFIRNGFIN